ncbi:Tricalbin-3 [Frankliniella fusca]|uniref:Tricalbin-3 n=1 Tax=Frankliniella fusca TaxID=407009 RepID=A0AAE1HY96_9NEOP|nr:Tricalbin-3 [Frankliniella fusca]
MARMHLFRAAGAGLLLLQLAAAGPGPGAPAVAPDEDEDPGMFQKLKMWCRSYAISRGLALMYSDDDIKCLLMVARAMRKDFSPMVQPAVTMYNFIMHTTPRCKVSLVAKGRIFLDSDFLKGVANVLFGISTTTTEPPGPAAPPGRRARA